MPISENIKQSIIALYKTNISIAAISRQTKVSEPTIAKILKAAGITIRKKNYQKLNIDYTEVNRRYRDGESTYEIAASLGCSDETIRLMIDNIRDARTRNKLKSESIAKIAIAAKNNWLDPEYVAKVTAATSNPEYLEKLAKAGRENYKNSLGKWIATAEAKLVISNKVKQQWANPDYRAKQEMWFRQRIETITKASRLALSDPTKRQNWLSKLKIANANRRQSGGWVSTAQKQLYYILSSSGIDFHEEGPETRIGPFYVVDCVIPQQQRMTKPLIIEVQGEYWHSLPNVMMRDRQKVTYVRVHTDYDLLPLPELNLSSFTEVEQKLATYGLDLNKLVCRPKQLVIKQIDETIASMFYSIFHYSGTVRKGAIVYGAYLGDELVAAISYCYPMRMETTTRLGYNVGEVVEISRLARRTNLLCKNLISYLIAKTKILLPQKIKCIVSFSDATYNHTGKVYKAAGFVNDGIVPADYHYVSINGKYHKKTIWDRAKRMKMTEVEYANKYNLAKVPHGEKTRWIARLRN
jgi:hypothetical protein